jgi:threonine aldolase
VTTTIDLRSDTVTRPTPPMRRAIAEAEVGDDQWGDDPTVARLEAMSCERLGHEAAIYVPSGVMANQLALRSHTRPGDEVICGEWCHVRNYESGAAGALAGVQLRTLGDLPAGCPEPEAVANALLGPRYHLPTPSLLALEDTHNVAGGRVIPPERLKELRAAGGGLPVHLDGARLFNAAVALGVEVSALAESSDTVSFCLSKGLGAPVGSVLSGHADLIEVARRWRSAYGGAMRQAGIIAAAGVYALEHHVERLADDHERARRLAAALGAPRPDTNIVLLDLGDEERAATFVARLAENGVLAVLFPRPAMVRFCLHLDIGDQDLERAIAVALRCLES